MLLGLQSLIQKLLMTTKLCLYLVVNLCNDLYECLLNIRGIESTSLNEGHSPVVGILLGFLKGNFSSINKVTLVAHKKNNNVLLSIIHELSSPFIVDALERFVARYVINKECSNCISVVSIGYCSISFLSCCVPNLSSDFRLQTSLQVFILNFILITS